MQINWPPFLVTPAHRNKLVVKHYQKTATELQPRAPLAIPSCLFSAPRILLKIQLQLLSYPLTPERCRQSSSACRSSHTADQGTVKQPGKEDRKNTPCQYIVLLGHSVGLTRMQPQLKRFRHIQKPSEYSKIRYQKC